MREISLIKEISYYIGLGEITKCLTFKINQVTDSQDKIIIKYNTSEVIDCQIKKYIEKQRHEFLLVEVFRSENRYS